MRLRPCASRRCDGNGEFSLIKKALDFPQERAGQPCVMDGDPDIKAHDGGMFFTQPFRTDRLCPFNGRGIGQQRRKKAPTVKIDNLLRIALDMITAAVPRWPFKDRAFGNPKERSMPAERVAMPRRARIFA